MNKHKSGDQKRICVRKYVFLCIVRFRHTWRSLRASCLGQKDHNHSCIDINKHIKQNKNQNLNIKVK
jgi:hypothetical protein